jgi:hypothetical protein
MIYNEVQLDTMFQEKLSGGEQSNNRSDRSASCALSRTGFFIL